jgi:flagellar basal-body rod protein FlgB
VLRAERQRIIASNIANADTPGYAARDLNFKDAMNAAGGGGLSAGLSASTSSLQGSSNNGTTHARHIPLSGSTSGTLGGGSTLAYAAQTQPTVDGNSVDLDRERANFVDNSVRYEATLRFINGQSKTILSAIQGQ